MDAERTKRRGAAAAAAAWLRMASRPETTAREREADGFWMRIWLWLHSALHNALMQAVVEQSSSLDDFWGLHALDWECPRPGWGETLVQMAAKRPSRVHTKWPSTGSSVVAERCDLSRRRMEAAESEPARKIPSQVRPWSFPLLDGSLLRSQRPFHITIGTLQAPPPSFWDPSFTSASSRLLLDHINAILLLLLSFSYRQSSRGILRATEESGFAAVLVWRTCRGFTILSRLWAVAVLQPPLGLPYSSKKSRAPGPNFFSEAIAAPSLPVFRDCCLNDHRMRVTTITISVPILQSTGGKVNSEAVQ
ncbi:hypothetical protein MRS44_003287 [Fusarium solani]|uniref:uncharacterized protein n=1 Tax=Fusarium solani TaxID=169388 RepID=UPI0032C40104|nr:hypothetical protein MRS44_003287 [Fusarium solani]